jgi:hypothetical protein
VVVVVALLLRPRPHPRPLRRLLRHPQPLVSILWICIRYIFLQNWLA